MKSRRQEKILELILRNDINTQEELLRALSDEGFDVTQATISRDIKDLHLIKTLSADGKYKYVAEQMPKHDISLKFHSLFTDAVISVVPAGNLVVIKTIAGMANAVCAAMDMQSFTEIVGTIAGDDTIFIACKTELLADTLAYTLEELIKK